MRARVFQMCCLFVLFTGSGYAQQPVNVAACFSPVLQHVDTFTSATNFDLAYFAQMDSDRWMADSKNGGVAILGIAAGTYSQFSQQREKLFQQTALNIHYFQNIKLSSIGMDAGAYEVIKECLKDTARRQGGLTYVVTNHDQTAVSIRFYWYPTTPDAGLPIRAVGENVKSLDPDVTGNQLFPTGTKVTSVGTPLELSRVVASNPLRIVLKTTPPVDYEPIYIEPFVGSPEFKPTWVVMTFTDAVEPDPQYKIGEVAYNSVYQRQLDFAGPVISVNSGFHASYYHMEICQPIDSEHKSVRIQGNKERSDTRSAWYTTVQYLNPVKICIRTCGNDNNTAIVDENTPANYSFNAVQTLVDENRGCVWNATKVH